MEKPKDRDFIETPEGLIFCVVGYLHPPDRYTAYLKYVPNENGNWSREETNYRRVIPFYHVSQVEKTYEFLRNKYPEYLYACPVRNILLSSVPSRTVKKYYRPREKLKDLLESPKDDLEWKLKDLVVILCGISGNEPSDLGVTGSLLTSSHNPVFSDMDITVYGMDASKRLKDAILEMRKEESVIEPFNAAKKLEWSMSRANRFLLSADELMAFAERRWNYGVYSSTYFSVHPIRTDGEITEEYGENKYKQLGEIVGEAVISDASESIFLPAFYGVEDVKLKGREIANLDKIASYEGLFCDMFDPGERVEFCGILERVSGKVNFHRIVVGGAGSRPSYIKRAIEPDPSHSLLSSLP